MSQKEIWDAIWSKQKHEDWDPLSEQIYQCLLQESEVFKGKTVLEAGSGSGRISLRLACEGAQVILVDYSEAALRLAREMFLRAGQSAEYVLADITNLPHGMDLADITWNAGVLEHLSFIQQIKALKEMRRVTKPGGRIISLNPNARCLPYRIGKYLAEKMGTWPYGIENPVYTLRPVCKKAGLKLVREYSTGLLEALDFLHFIPNSQSVRAVMEQFIKDLPAEEASAFPGYLLVSVMARD